METNAKPFIEGVKTTETLKTIGHRLFPLPKNWIIWVDENGSLHDIVGILKEATSPVISAPYPDPRRTSESEVDDTINWIRMRGLFPERLNDSILNTKLQEKEYQLEGFYLLSHHLKLKMYDIAIFMYRNHHPCIFRYLYSWHNEVNYFLYIGQLSVYYPAVRLNLTNYLQFLSEKFNKTYGHQSVC